MVGAAVRDVGAEIEGAVAVLRAGGLVAFPTETVYGLGADATNVAALRRLYAVKGRPLDHPVIVHLAEPADLGHWATEVSADARRLTEACWPGPLTVVVRRSSRVPDEVTGGGDTVGVRVPDQPTARALLRAFGGGIAAPSANRFGRVSPTTAEHVRADLGDDVDLVLDDGPCDVGVESTIVDCSGPEPIVLRLGGVGREALEALLQRPIDTMTTGERAAPGTLAAHYAPRAQVVVVNADEADDVINERMTAGDRVGLLAPAGTLGDRARPPGLVVLDPPLDPDEYARVLYARLRDADAAHLDVLVAVAPPSVGIGAAVADRLARAAAGSSR